MAYPALGAVGAVAGGVSSILGGNARSKAFNQAMTTISNMYEQNKNMLAPYRQAGETAVNQLSQKVTAGPGDFYQSPDYNFRLQEGQKALDRRASAAGIFNTGGQEKANMQYNQNYATTAYQQFLNNYYQSLAPLQNLTATGLNAATTTGNWGQQAANSIAGAQIGKGNARASMFGDIGSSIAGGLNQWNKSLDSTSSFDPSSSSLGYANYNYGSNYDPEINAKMDQMEINTLNQRQGSYGNNNFAQDAYNYSDKKQRNPVRFSIGY